MDPSEDTGQGESEGRVDFRFYWTVVKKRRWIIAATTITITALAVVLAMRKPRIYEATATVIVDPQAPNVLGRDSVEVVQLGSGSPWINTEYYNTQYRILTSRSLAREVVQKYHLHRDPRIVGEATGSVSEDVLIDTAAGAVQGRVQVTVVKDSRVFAISIRDTDPKLAAELANYVADVYIEQNLTVKRDVTRNAKGWVAKQLDEARSELQESETALIAYKQNNNILSVSLEDRQNILSKALETFSGALTETRKKRIDVQARRKAVALLIETDALNAPSTYASQVSTIDAVREGYLEERRKLMALNERYGPKHPEVIAQQARVDAALSDLKEEARVVLRSIDAEIKALRDAETAYQAEVNRLTEEAFELNKRELEYKRLMRDASGAEANYKLLSERLSESGLQEQVHANNIRQLDQARQPGSPVEPNVRVSGLLGFGLGLMLAFGLAFFIEFLDRSVRSQEDIEALGLPFLGMVPSIESGPSDVGKSPELSIARQPNSTVAECCRVIRTNILFCSPDKPLKTLVVTSSNPVEGKTMSAINLGIVMAQNGHRTLLVDTDMRRPRLHKALGVPNDNGVSRVVVGESDLDSAVKSTEVPNLFLMPCGPIPPNPSELLQTEKFAALARNLGAKFDRVIFDSPPIMAVTDAAVLSRVADATVLVVRAGRTSRDAIVRAKHAIATVNPNIVGVVLNDVDLKNPHYANYYQYYHYQYHEAPAGAARDGG